MIVSDLEFSLLHFYLLTCFWLFLLNMQSLKMRCLDLEGGRGQSQRSFNFNVTTQIVHIKFAVRVDKVNNTPCWCDTVKYDKLSRLGVFMFRK